MGLGKAISTVAGTLVLQQEFSCDYKNVAAAGSLAWGTFIAATRHHSGIASVPLILIVEDDPFIALDLETLLRAEGYYVIGPAKSVPSALALLEHVDPDATVLDVNLKDAKVTPVARELARRGVPERSIRR